VSPTYQFFAQLAQTWGLVYFFLVFLGVLAYALWPSRQKQFDESARVAVAGGLSRGRSQQIRQKAASEDRHHRP
jgi:cytochrome c oxidase cbb3-type subunit 4